MAWTYSQQTGKLTSPAGLLVGAGYSGGNCGKNPEGVNNPAYQDQHMIGPIPQGSWTIGKFFDDTSGKGPIVAHLTPNEGTNMYGRTGLMVHGDNSKANHSASEGCVILAHSLREMLMASNDRTLIITA
jgi:hypothetical protein